MNKLNILSARKITSILGNRESSDGIKCSLTDYSILLGSHIDKSENENTTKRIGSYWTSDTPLIESNNKGSRIVIEGNNLRYSSQSSTQIATRPILITTDKSFEELSEYEYPSRAVEFQLGQQLERLKQIGKLRKTGKSYARVIYKGCKSDFEGEKRSYNSTIEMQDEYIYEGHKYIRVKATPAEENTILQNGSIINCNTIQWVEVEPIELISTREGYLFKNAIIGGMKYDEVEYFMNNYMLNDLIPSHVEESDKIVIIDSSIKYENGSNITISIPKEILDKIDTITLEAIDTNDKPKVYYKR